MWLCGIIQNAVLCCSDLLHVCGTNPNEVHGELGYDIITRSKCLHCHIWFSSQPKSSTSTVHFVIWPATTSKTVLTSSGVCVCVLLARASPAVVLSMWPCKNISYIQVLIIYFFPTPPIKLKLGLRIGGRLLIATHLDQSNYLTNQQEGAVNKFDLTVFIRLFQGAGRCACFQGCNSLPVDQLDRTVAPHLRFPVQGHILSTGGEALSWCCCNLQGKKKDELFRLIAQKELLFKIDISKCTWESQ